MLVLFKKGRDNLVAGSSLEPKLLLILEKSNIILGVMT